MTLVLVHNDIHQLHGPNVNSLLVKKNYVIFRSAFSLRMNTYIQRGIELDEVKFEENAAALQLVDGQMGLILVLNGECVHSSLPLVHTMMHNSAISCDEVDRRMSHNREKSVTLITNSLLQSHNESQKEQMTTKSLQRHGGASCSDIPSLLYSSSDEDSVSLKSISGFQNELLYYDSDPGENESTARTRQYQLRPMSFPDCHSSINKEGHLIGRSQLRAVLTSAFDRDDEDFKGNDNNNCTDETANASNAPSNTGLRSVGEES